MRRLLSLVLILGIAYLVFLLVTDGLPGLDRLRGDEPETVDPIAEARACLAAAESARDVLTDQVRSFAQPPVDANLWAAALVHVSGELGGADAACGCSSAVCGDARLALAELRRQLDLLVAAVRGEELPPGALEAAARRADALLQRARDHLAAL